MATKIRPMHDPLIIERLKQQQKTKGGIIIPGYHLEKPQEGRVIAAGLGK